jgi:hypothetical protein
METLINLREVIDFVNDIENQIKNLPAILQPEDLMRACNNIEKLVTDWKECHKYY